MAAKNTQGRRRTKDKAYQVYRNGGWTWYVLKHYQTPEQERANRYARVFTLVEGNFTEMGDTYCRDIPGYRYGAEDGAVFD